MTIQKRNRMRNKLAMRCARLRRYTDGKPNDTHADEVHRYIFHMHQYKEWGVPGLREELGRLTAITTTPPVSRARASGLFGRKADAIFVDDPN